MRSKKLKPDKEPFIDFYIVSPIETLIDGIIDFFSWVWRTLSGAWYCSHCKRYHGRRVHKFLLRRTLFHMMYDEDPDYVCSLYQQPVQEKPNLKTDADKEIMQVALDVGPGLPASMKAMTMDEHLQTYSKDPAN